MGFIRRRGFCSVAVALVSSLVASCFIQNSQAWVPHIVSKGNKFFDSESGAEFRMKGVAYYPRPNTGELYKIDNYDWAADEHEDIWLPHLDKMQELGANTIRLYSVDPSKSHDKFMRACSERGIYVLVGMAAPCKNCAILDALPPKCYPDDLFTRAQMVYNAFAVYDNTLGFSVGDENNLQKLAGNKDGTSTKNSTLKMSTFTPQHTEILKCPKNIDNTLRPTPKVPYLKCSVAQPVRIGAKSNAFEKQPSKAIKMGEKKRPSNNLSGGGGGSSASNADLTPKKKADAMSGAGGSAHAALSSAVAVVAAAATLWMTL